MSKNAQIDASKDSLETSEKYLANRVEMFQQMIFGLDISHSEKTELDEMVRNIRHYTYRVALSKASLDLAERLQGVYLACGDPTDSKPYWKYISDL
jgi:hypothetical protein